MFQAYTNVLFPIISLHTQSALLTNTPSLLPSHSRVRCLVTGRENRPSSVLVDSTTGNTPTVREPRQNADPTPKQGPLPDMDPNTGSTRPTTNTPPPPLTNKAAQAYSSNTASSSPPSVVDGGPTLNQH